MKETKEAVALLAGLVRAMGGAYADKKFGLEDLAHLIPVAGLVQPAVDGIDQISVELKALDEAAEADLRAYVDEQFGASAFEMLGEDLLLGAVHLASAIKKAQGLEL